jgi:Bacterial trigger factor protein (TF)
MLRGEQARKLGRARSPQCAASSVSQASGKRSAGFEIDVKEEPQANSHVQFTVTLPPQLVKKSYDKAVNNIKKEVDLPGFRKGSKVHGWRCSWIVFHANHAVHSNPSVNNTKSIHERVWQITTETLLKFVDGGKPRLKKLAIEDLLQATLHRVRHARLLVHARQSKLRRQSSVFLCCSRDLLRTLHLPQVLSKYEGITIDGSVNIKSPVDDLVAAFDETKELQYVVGIDLAPKVAWKSPYRDISVGHACVPCTRPQHRLVGRMHSQPCLTLRLWQSQ